MPGAGQCWSGGEPGDFLVTGSEVTVPPRLSCPVHLGDLAAALIIQSDAGSALVTVPGRRRRKKSRLLTVDQVAEEVRRISAGARREPFEAELAEHDMFAAVLAAIADGTPSPVHLATAALVTLRYRHSEWRRQ